MGFFGVEVEFCVGVRAGGVRRGEGAAGGLGGEVVFQGSVSEGEAAVVLELHEMTAMEFDAESDVVVEAGSENFGGDGLARVLCCGCGECVRNLKLGKLQAFLLEDGPLQNLLNEGGVCWVFV